MKTLVSVTMMILTSSVAIAETLCLTQDQATRFDIETNHSGGVQRITLNALPATRSGLATELPQALAQFDRERGSLFEKDGAQTLALNHPTVTFHSRSSLAGQMLFELVAMSLSYDFSRATAAPGGEQGVGSLLLRRKDGRTERLSLYCFRPLED